MTSPTRGTEAVTLWRVDDDGATYYYTREDDARDHGAGVVSEVRALPAAAFARLLAVVEKAESVIERTGSPCPFCRIPAIYAPPRDHSEACVLGALRDALKEVPHAR